MRPRDYCSFRLKRLIAAALVSLAIGYSVATGQQAGTGETRPPLDAVRRKQIEGWIAQLDADSYDTREAASRHLLSVGEEALPLLEPQSRHPSPEVRFRVTSILRSLAHVPLRRLEEEMEAFCALPDERLEVERGMCLISRLMDRDVAEKDLVSKLDEIAAKVKDQLAEGADPDRVDPERAIAAIQQVIYKDYAFRGNEEDYGNPDNCSLAFVLKERKGKPILLAEITVSVARRAKIPIVGIPAPGRYLAKYDGKMAPAGFRRDDIYFDPFGGGVILSREDLLRLFPDQDPDRMVPPGTNRETITRILRNITADYRNSGAAADPGGRELVERMLELLESRMAVP
jgi:regulator of sirC expression with transglutaminase-like and TPR domain